MLYADPRMRRTPTVGRIRRMWAVTTQGDLPDEHESRDHPESVPAWDDYRGRNLELEVHGYTQESESAAEYGKRWVCELSRGAERITVTITRTL